MRTIRRKVLPVFIIVYVMLASGWWGWLLFQKNEELYEARLMMLINDADDFGWPDEYFSVQLQELNAKQKRQRLMIYGESVVFIAILIAGGWFVYGGMRRELKLARQQRNFLLSVTHELKSPVASIQLAAETMLMRNLNVEQIRELSGSTYQEAKRLEKLIGNILMATRLEASAEIQKTEISLNELISEAVKDMQTRYQDFEISANVPDETVQIKGDVGALRMAIDNLLENAIQYSGDSKTVSVNVLTDQKNKVKIEVLDLGIGIAGAERKQVLKKFYRIGREDTRQYKGTGLGLYIVHQVMKAHNGNINIAENHPAGTRIVLTLPKK